MNIPTFYSTTPYARGRNKEYRIIKRLKKLGNYDIIVRTAQSHSPFDIIAIDLNEKRIKLIQSKLNATLPMIEKLLKDNSKLNGVFNVEFAVNDS